MSSSDTSLTQAWNSEAAETEVEYDLEVEVWSNASEQEDNKDDVIWTRRCLRIKWLRYMNCCLRSCFCSNQYNG